MKLLRYGMPGQEKPGALDARGQIRDLSQVLPDVAGEVLQPKSVERLRKTDLTALPEVDSQVRLGPCVGAVGKFICVGLNYSDHAVESGFSIPREPVLFMKATSAICGPNDNVIIP